MNFKGSRVLITAGPTIEKWDTVRYLTSFSSGKMGLALALAAAGKGAEATLISSIREHSNYSFRHILISSCIDMYEAVKENFLNCDIFIAAAAAADFRPVREEKKVKKRNCKPVIKLERNPDILKWTGENRKNQVLVGFSLEDKPDIKEAQRKKQEKNCQLMIVNTAENMGSDRKSFILLCDNETRKYENVKVEDAAQIILENVR